MALIDGTQLAKEILNNLKEEIKALAQPLGLAAVMVGDDPALKKFVELKKKAAHSIGIEFSSYLIEQDASPEQIAETMGWLAKDDDIHGILVELPVPKGFDVQAILDLIPRSKDVDVLTTSGEADFYKDRSIILPPAVQALAFVLESYEIDLTGRKVAIVGQGRLVGKPITHWVTQHGAQVFMIDELTDQPGVFTRQADIIISGVGKPGIITADMVKDDAIVIDYGYGAGGKGDVDFEAVAKKALLITPVPGGMGPLVIAGVLKNLITLSEQ